MKKKKYRKGLSKVKIGRATMVKVSEMPKAFSGQLKFGKNGMRLIKGNMKMFPALRVSSKMKLKKVV